MRQISHRLNIIDIADRLKRKRRKGERRMFYLNEEHLKGYLIATETSIAATLYNEHYLVMIQSQHPVHFSRAQFQFEDLISWIELNAQEIVVSQILKQFQAFPLHLKEAEEVEEEQEVEEGEEVGEEVEE